jgi:hypothetical protein
MPDLIPDDPALWLSISEVARRKGLAVPTVFEKAKRLERDGKIEIRPGERGRKLINLAQYDRALGETTDLARSQAAATTRGELLDEPAAPPGAAPAPGRSFTSAQTSKALYDAGIRAIDFAAARDKVLPIDGDHGVAQAMREVADELVQAIGRMHLAAGEINSIAGKEGERGVRLAIKRLGRDVLAAYAAALRRLVEKGKGLEQLGGYPVELPEPDTTAAEITGEL